MHKEGVTLQMKRLVEMMYERKRALALTLGRLEDAEKERKKILWMKEEVRRNERDAHLEDRAKEAERQQQMRQNRILGMERARLEEIRRRTNKCVLCVCL